MLLLPRIISTHGRAMFLISLDMVLCKNLLPLVLMQELGIRAGTWGILRTYSFFLINMLPMYSSLIIILMQNQIYGKYSTVFKTAALNHSANFPEICAGYASQTACIANHALLSCTRTLLKPPSLRLARQANRACAQRIRLDDQVDLRFRRH